MSSSRLPAPAGTRLDRSRKLGFEFNGREYQGFQGDTLASALFANGVTLVGRSFKLHRPRGVYSCGIEEPTGIVDLGNGTRRTPNARASVVELHEGLTAASVNCWPSVGFDLAAVNGGFSALLPAGFYYKTFMWPSWRWFEPTIRRLAGLGVAPSARDPDGYEEIAANVDVLIVGGGVAGLSAAIGAAEAGARTLLVTNGPEIGGALRAPGGPASPAADREVPFARCQHSHAHHGVRHLRSQSRVRPRIVRGRRPVAESNDRHGARTSVED